MASEAGRSLNRTALVWRLWNYRHQFSHCGRAAFPLRTGVGVDVQPPVSLLLDPRDATAEMMEYLEGIEASASSEHLKLRFEVYGPDWGRPFEGLYKPPIAGYQQMWLIRL